jgi:hypothetical protein
MCIGIFDKNIMIVVANYSFFINVRISRPCELMWSFCFLFKLECLPHISAIEFG